MGEAFGSADPNTFDLTENIIKGGFNSIGSGVQLNEDRTGLVMNWEDAGIALTGNVAGNLVMYGTGDLELRTLANTTTRSLMGDDQAWLAYSNQNFFSMLGSILGADLARSLDERPIPRDASPMSEGAGRAAEAMAAQIALRRREEEELGGALASSDGDSTDDTTVSDVINSLSTDEISSIIGKDVREVNFKNGANAETLANAMLQSHGGNQEAFAEWLAINGGSLESLQQRINNGDVRFMEGFDWTNDGQKAYDQIRGIKNNEALLSTPIGGVPEPSNSGIAQSKPLFGIPSALYEIGVGINNAFKDAKDEIRSNYENDAPWLVKLQDNVAVGMLSVGEMLTPEGYSDSDKVFAAMDFFPGLGKVTGAVLSMAAPFFKLGKKSKIAEDIFKNALLGEGDILSKNLAKEIHKMSKEDFVNASNTIGSLLAGFELKKSLGNERLLNEGLEYLKYLRGSMEGRKTLIQIQNVATSTLMEEKDLSLPFKHYLASIIDLAGF